MPTKYIPRYPIFIPTKGRYDSRLTIRVFDNIDIDYKIVIEEQEYKSYNRYVDKNKILVLPHKDKGLTVTRNWIWDYAQSLGVKRFWTFDDNIGSMVSGRPIGIYRFHKNLKVPVETAAPLIAIEDWVDRYKNIAIAGMNYFMFASRKSGNIPPITFNTRIYSNMLIKTNIPFRNETFYNDDTDLCLRVLKSGFCTALFNAFLIEKRTTMTVKGGMTDYYEKTNNRLEFAKELQQAHPDVVKITKKWGRWHHHVDYRPFRGNKLIKKTDIEISDEPNNYGMKLVRIHNDG